MQEDFVNEEGIAVALALPLQSSGKFDTEFDTPEANCFIADSDTAFCQKIFNITMAQIESVVEPDVCMASC